MEIMQKIYGGQTKQVPAGTKPKTYGDQTMQLSKGTMAASS
jgi:hypothetical protein